MARPNPNSIRQKVLTLPIGETVILSVKNRDYIKGLLFDLKVQFGHVYALETVKQTCKVTRIS